MPVPGGSDSINSSFYESEEDLLKRLDTLEPGLSEEEVFTRLGHERGTLSRLERDQIVLALYGSTAVSVTPTADEKLKDGAFLKSLYGYRLFYKTVRRKHGFSSPIRIQTDEKGFDYQVTLVFRNGALYDRPIVSGGVVNATSTQTFFDLLGPERVLDQTPLN